MKRIKLYVLIAATLLLCSCTKNNNEKNLTQIRVAPTHQNLGRISKENRATVDFIIHNIGNYPLKINEIKTDCHCTVVNFNKKDVLPGDSTKVSLEYFNKSYTGYFQQIANITSNAKQSPLLLVIRGLAE